MLLSIVKESLKFKSIKSFITSPSRALSIASSNVSKYSPSFSATAKRAKYSLLPVSVPSISVTGLPVNSSLSYQPTKAKLSFVTSVGRITPSPTTYSVTSPLLIVPPFVFKTTLYVLPIQLAV